jgi:hypothetical protein
MLKMRGYQGGNKMNLRNNLIKLAHQKPDLRKHLLPMIKEAGLSWKKDMIEAVSWGGESTSKEGFVAGGWGVLKIGNKWNLTLISEGKSIGSFKSAKAAKEALETIVDAEPALLKGGILRVQANKDLILSAISGELPFESIMSKAGLRNLGERSQKHGDHWGIPGASLRIRVGKRDLVLTEWSPEYQHGKLTGAWRMEEIQYRKKVTPQLLGGWIKMIKKAPSTKELRQKLKDDNTASPKHLTDDGHSFRLQRP